MQTTNFTGDSYQEMEILICNLLNDKDRFRLYHLKSLN